MATTSPLSSKYPVVFLQNACLQHKYIRSRDTSSVVERPERLRAVSVGLAAVISRIEEYVAHSAITTGRGSDEPKREHVDPTKNAEEELTTALDRLKISSSQALPRDESPVIRIVQSSATVDILDNPAVKYIHGDIEGDEYLKKLKAWVESSRDKISKGQSEIPEGLPQNDLYLCPESLNAIQGAIGTVIEAVDMVVDATRSRSSTPQTFDASLSSSSRAFVAIRPPGHHCGEDTPSGFCFVNNIAIAAAHAHLRHGMKRVVIFDIDLHHGNGTQSIIWQINEETYRQALEEESGVSKVTGPTIFYGSLHDILSYPCEDGKPELVQAASVSIHKAHGQYIENVHLQQYESEDHFWNTLYTNSYSRLLHKAEEFLESTSGPDDDVLFFISCGLDACEHEYPSMSRHNRKVPTSFYYQFTRDACLLADKYANGRLISVLEGGYSDRALISGVFAHLAGLTELENATTKKNGLRSEIQDWWSIANLEKLEKATKKRRGGRPSASNSAALEPEPWLERASALFSTLDTGTRSVPRNGASAQPNPRTLRNRKKPAVSAPTTSSSGAGPSASVAPRGRKNTPPSATPSATQSRTASRATSATAVAGEEMESSELSSGPGSTEGTSSPPLPASTTSTVTGPEAKKLPKVILRLGPNNT